MAHPLRLRGAQVILRDFTADDLDGVHALVGDDRVTIWLSFDTRSRDEAHAMLDGILQRARLESRQEFYLAVALPEAEHEIIGFARLALDGVQAGKLGYAIHPSHQGRNYATDAMRTLIDFAFTTLGLHRVSAAIGPDNEASIAVALKIGMSYEGCIRHHVHTNGSWRDSLLYSVLEPDWPTANVGQ